MKGGEVGGVDLRQGGVGMWLQAEFVCIRFNGLAWLRMIVAERIVDAF